MPTESLLTGHTTVQASAGSGKTYLLISRVIHLLLNGVESGHILAITFTRKAANEMQTRLLERLYLLATCNNKDLDSALADLQLEITPALKTLARGLYEKILRAEHSVKTTTFHAFCQELLQRFPMEADVPPGFDLLDKTSLLYDEAWEALMVIASANEKSHIAESLDFLFKELGLFNTKQALINFIDHRSDWWAYSLNQPEPVEYAIEKLHLQLELNDLQDPVSDLFNTKDLFSFLNEFHLLLVKHDTATNLKTSVLIYNVLDENIDQAKRYDSLKKCFLTQDGNPLKTRKASKSQEKKMGFEGQQRFLELHDIICTRLVETEQNIAKIRTFKISSAWYIAGQHYLNLFQKIKQEQRQLDFNDLEWQAYLLLNQSNNALWIQYKLDQRIEHLLVDEFQDTNPTQWRLILPLLEELAASDDVKDRSVFLVGDEKQSIYRFRRAEPRLFKAAEKWLREQLNAKTHPLSHSWRSSPAIIQFINRLFNHVDFKALLPTFQQHETHRNDLHGEVTLLPLSLKNVVTTNETGQSSSFRNPLIEARTESSNQAYYNEGILISNHIKTLINNKIPAINNNISTPINYNDIIILLRSRTHVDSYEQALRENGIPYLGAARGTLLDSLEVNDILDLLQWLILPFDNLLLAGILRSPIFNLTNDDLINIKQSAKESWREKLSDYTKNSPDNESARRANSLLTNWLESADKLPVHDLLDRIYSEANVIERYSSAFPNHLKQRVTANLNRLLELALEMDSGRYPSITGFSAWINQLRQLNNDAPDEPVTQGTEQRVRILSVHAAKGLEAPVIFLADSASTPLNRKANTTLIDWPADKTRPEYLFLTGAKKHQDLFSQECIKQHDYFEQREDANLLYVALTRAKQYLIISGSEPKATDLGWYGKISKAFEIKNYEQTETLSEYNTDKIGNIKIPEIHSQDSLKFINKIAEELSQPVKITSHQIDISPSNLPDGNLKTSDSENLSADENTERGIIMHKMLDYLTRQTDIKLHEFMNHEISTVETGKLENWWFECENLVKHEQFVNYFNTEKYDKAYNEVPIQFKDKGYMVFGIIDRLIIKGNNATIIDYKTHPYATNENLEKISDAYKIQLQLYQKGVQLLWPNYKVTSLLIYTSIAGKYQFNF